MLKRLMMTTAAAELVVSSAVAQSPAPDAPGQKIAIGCAGAPVAPRSRIGVAVKRNS